jgi:manganese-dependent inorganic pyrophosphatase
MLTNVLAASGSPADRHETWDPRLTYVVGHQRPDTDAIASALGYAWFLSHTGHAHVRAARAGQPGDQAVFALKRFDQAAPPLLRAVAPTFGHIAGACPTVLPDAKLAEAMALLAEGAQVVPVVDAEGRPLGVVTPLALARVYSQSMSGDNGGVGTTRRVRAVIASAPLFTPALLCHEIAEALPTFRAGERISDYRTPLVRSDSNQYLVVDAAGRYVGLATQRSVLQPPRARLILVDHNELGQAVVGADEAEIVGVLDHHRLGNPPTAAPIPFVVDPVGSTSTLVAEACEADDLVPPPGIAGMLLSGILSDTLVFARPRPARVIGRWPPGWPVYAAWTTSPDSAMNCCGPRRALARVPRTRSWTPTANATRWGRPICPSASPRLR